MLSQEFITPYTPEQNGMIERFFRSLKEECVWQHSFAEAKRIIAEWIEWDNAGRPHQALGYQSPAEYRRKKRMWPDSPWSSVASASASHRDLSWADAEAAELTLRWRGFFASARALDLRLSSGIISDFPRGNLSDCRMTAIQRMA